MSDFLYNQYRTTEAQMLKEKEKGKEFLKRIEPFSEVKSLEEAKELMTKILPVKEGLTNFCIDNISRTVINEKNMLRISIDTPDLYKCYDFK